MPGPTAPPPTPGRAGDAAVGRSVGGSGWVDPRLPAGTGGAAAVDTTAGRVHRLYRSTDGRIVGGVAQGLARHLGVPAWLVRVAFALLALSSGAGLVAYAAFWALAPLSPEGRPPGTGQPQPPAGAGARADTRVAAADDQAMRLGPLLGLGAVSLGGVLLAVQLGVGPGAPVLLPLVVVGFGVALLWRVADDAQRARWLRTATGAATSRRPWLRVAAGVVLVSTGAAAVLGTRSGLNAALDGLVGAGVVLAGIALVAGPWLVRNARELSDERRERIRSQERAELAAHVHDSVVQTLTLIQRSADDPREVARLARAEERALRQWLYRPAGPQPGSFRDALEAAAADVEELHGGTLDVVVVGDAQLDERLTALLQASREAMINAAKFASAAGPVSVYAEVDREQVSVFVRDRGPGFAVDAVPSDRLGVRQSIIGRMERNGGAATVTSPPGEGAEVRLSMPRAGGAPTGSRVSAGDPDPTGAPA